MKVDLGVLAYLSEPEILEVFRKILKFRLLSRSELKKGEIEETKLIEVLDKLQSLGLIDKKSATFSEQDKYYPTSEGLEVERMVK